MCSPPRFSAPHYQQHLLKKDFCSYPHNWNPLIGFVLNPPIWRLYLRAHFQLPNLGREPERIKPFQPPREPLVTAEGMCGWEQGLGRFRKTRGCYTFPRTMAYLRVGSGRFVLSGSVSACIGLLSSAPPQMLCSWPRSSEAAFLMGFSTGMVLLWTNSLQRITEI